MCTVTYIHTNNGFYFTSSRDEKASRLTIPPTYYLAGGIELIYPKDELAGGTWIASSPKGRTACLLNGAFVNHTKKNNYAKSRGLILLESFNCNNTFEFANKIELQNIEPFTLLTLDYKLGVLSEFIEFRWDGEGKYLRKLSHDTNQIWSSATLYTPAIQSARALLFEEWINKNVKFDDKSILNFHNRKHGLKTSDDILMKGEGDLMTLSISQIHLEKSAAHFNYFDLIASKDYKIKLNKNELVNA